MSTRTLATTPWRIGGLWILILVELTMESPLASPMANTSPSTVADISSQPFPIVKPSAEISYFWHQKTGSLVPIWPLENPVTTNKDSGGRVILIHRITDDPDELREFMNSQTSKWEPLAETNGRPMSTLSASSVDENSNIFIFCLMFLFGLIIVGLIWCLCTVSRPQFDSQGNPIQTYRERRRRSSCARLNSGRRAGLQVVMPYTSDLPPAYDDIVADFEKLGAQCILPSYREIMRAKTSNEQPPESASSPPPPRYVTPHGSFSGQGNLDTNSTSSET